MYYIFRELGTGKLPIIFNNVSVLLNDAKIIEKLVAVPVSSILMSALERMTVNQPRFH